MSAEIFRFMTIRPPQAAGDAAATNLVDLSDTRSDLLTSLAQKRKAGARDAMEKLAQSFITNDLSFIDNDSKLPNGLAEFSTALLSTDDPDFGKQAKTAFSRLFSQSASDTLRGNDFQKLIVALTESIVASVIAPDAKASNRDLLVAVARAVGLVQQLTRDADLKDYTRADFLDQPILLPPGIFPLPTAKQDLSSQDEAEDRRRKSTAEERARLIKLAGELAANRKAINDIVSAYEKTSFQPDRPVSIAKRAGDETHSVPGGFVLGSADVGRLARDTKGVLKNAALEGSIDVARTVSLIERRSREINDELYARRRPSPFLVKIGSGFVPSDALVVSGLPVAGEDSLRQPGPCPAVAPIEAGTEVSVPLWTSHGEARALGFADLMIVEQELLRYELGEISHIENVLIGEERSRQFRTATTSERIVETETEITEEKTQDLASTERFELQSESANVINEATNIQAGVTVSASYGPSVDVTANFNYSSNSAKQLSNRTSNTFARETTSKATSKIQKRTLERRVLRTVEEIEEINKHGFQNRENDARNISGVYRFLDKIYKAQVVNYGKRFMLEFMVPEPGAFVRYAATNQLGEGLVQTKPDEPGYCDNGGFVRLQPQDITPDHYMYWASKYLASDVVPPPSSTQIISGVLINETPGTKSQFTDDIYEASELKDLKVPAGYKPAKAIISAEGWNVAKQGVPSTFCLQVQKEVVIVPNQAVITVALESDVTDKIPIAVVTKNYEKYAVVANLFCVLTREALEAWQIKTFSSIMNAYSELKTRYDNAIEAARIRSSMANVSGTNPAANREREKIELKKGCLELLTGQSFEQFNSVRRNVAPHGYPEIAFEDAQAEGRYIQFFENAFEWVNMTYVFYPYFWGKKDDWTVISQIDDTDAVYAQFLQAGAARVQVPVRPGYEVALTNFLGIRGMWFGDGALLNSTDDGEPEELYLSVLAELKEQLGNQNVVGKGRLNLTHGQVAVTGTGTDFTAADENRRIIILGKTYVVGEFVSPTEIRLSEPFSGPDRNGVAYAFGAVLVGDPWEVKIPTSLVMIDDDVSDLIVS